MVKNALNERFRKLTKILLCLESELNEYKHQNKFSKSKDMIKQENYEELKYKFSNQENQIFILKSEIEVN